MAVPYRCREDRGDPIPGSILIREFCKECKEPMRVVHLAEKEEDRPLCSECSFIKPPPSGTRQVYRQQIKKH